MEDKKKKLLTNISEGRDGFRMEEVFGASAWQKFESLHKDDEIVVVGNGPVKSFYGEYIDKARMVVRCNDYRQFIKKENGPKKIGTKCDVQFMCLHGSIFEKKGVKYLREWCQETDIALALENSGAKDPIIAAINEQKRLGDAVISKIHVAEDSALKKLCKPDSTRGFYAIAFALQAKNRLGLNNPVRCIGFGRQGHEGLPAWGVGHDHGREMELWDEMWRTGTMLEHLEWADYAEEIMAIVSPKKFFDCAAPIISPEMSLTKFKIDLEDGLTNVKNIINMARKSKFYWKISTWKLQEMATRGLIIHPIFPDYLTCSRHAKKGIFSRWPDAQTLCTHFETKHGCACEPPMQAVPGGDFNTNALPFRESTKTPRGLDPMAWHRYGISPPSAGPSDKPPAASDEKPPEAASDKPLADPPTRSRRKIRRIIKSDSSEETASKGSEVCEDASKRDQSKVLPGAASDKAPPDAAPDKPPAAPNEALPDAASDTEGLQNCMERFANFAFSVNTFRYDLQTNVNWALLNEF